MLRVYRGDTDHTSHLSPSKSTRGRPMDECNECREFQSAQEKSAAEPPAARSEVSEGGSAEQAIWVGVRIRPPSDKERHAREAQVWDVSEDDRELRLTSPTGPTAHASPQNAASPGKDSANAKSSQRTRYTADRVFGPEAANDEVYAQAARDIVRGALRGVNGTVFAYGQTGGGKTHTMRAITRGAVGDLFGAVQGDDERKYLMHFSAVEIYNEIVRDLLVDAPAPWTAAAYSNNFSNMGGKHGRDDRGGWMVKDDAAGHQGNEPTTSHLAPGVSEPLRLLDDPERGTVIERLVSTPVDSSEALEALLREVEARRQVGATGMNAESSRSHMIVRLTIESRVAGSSDEPAVDVEERGPALTATLNFVDLAGSERASRAQSSGARLTEGCHINRSLLTLGKVIRSLSEKGERGSDEHVPYRDSKLTRILASSLGGNARTAVITCISAAASALEATRAALFFAAQAKRVRNRATVNEVIDDKALIRRYRAEIAELQRIIALASGNTNSGEYFGTAEEIAHIREEKRAAEEARARAESRIATLERFLLGGPTAGDDDDVSLSEGHRFSSRHRRRRSWSPSPVKPTRRRRRGTPSKQSTPIEPSASAAGDEDTDHRGHSGRGKLGFFRLVGSTVRRSLGFALNRAANAKGTDVTSPTVSNPNTPRSAESDTDESGYSLTDDDTLGELVSLAAIRRARADALAAELKADTGTADPPPTPVEVVAAAAANEITEDIVHRTSIDRACTASPGRRAEAGRQLEAEQNLLRMGVTTHARRGESPDAVIERLQLQLRELQEDKVVYDIMDAAKETLIEGLECELTRLRSEQERMNSAQAAADALQQKLELLETDLGVFWKDGESPKPSLEGSGGSESSIDDHPIIDMEVNNTYDLADLRDSVLGSPLKSLAKIVTAGAKIVKVVDAALKEEEEDKSKNSVCVSPLSELGPSQISKHRHTRSSSRGSIGSTFGGKENFGGNGFMNPFSEAALAEYAAEAENDMSSWASDQTSKANGKLPEEPRTPIADPLSVDSRATVIVHHDRESEQREMDETFRRHRRAMSDLSGTTSPRADEFPSMKLEKTTLKHQMAGLRERFKEAMAEANLTRDALDGYKDTIQRVEFQKRLLCAQVLELEASLAEKEEEGARVAERARERERKLLDRAKAGSRLSRQTDSWAGMPSASFFLPKIVRLWHQLRVPLQHRSRFLLAFRGRETFYFEAEYRRLEWLKASLVTAGWRNPDADAGRGSVGIHDAATLPPSLKEAERRLVRERRFLRRMARRLERPQLEAVFTQWGIHLGSKRRKVRLVNLLWSDPGVCSKRRSRGAEGRSRSVDDDCFVHLREHAELVLQLAGVEATEDMFGLVFKAGTSSSGSETKMTRSLRSLWGGAGRL